MRIFSIVIFNLIISVFQDTNLQAQNVQDNKFRIDHVLIAVDNLDSAKKEYEQYGFTVVYGGDPLSALNALIFLKDGTLIELIGKDRFPFSYKLLNRLKITKLFGSMKDRITYFSSVPSGFFNYSIYSDRLDSSYYYLKSKGIKVDKPKEFKRKRDDNVIVKWQLIGIKPYDLPFVIGDYHPSRVSDSSFLNHRNKAIALDSLFIETTDFDSYVNDYSIFYQQAPLIKIIHDKRCANYNIKGITIHLMERTSIKTFFKKKDQSATSSFVVRCEGENKVYPQNINHFIKLVNSK